MMLRQLLCIFSRVATKLNSAIGLVRLVAGVNNWLMDSNSKSLNPNQMKLGHIIGYQEGKTPIDCGENRSKVKVMVAENTLKISEIFGFRTITQKVCSQIK